MAVVNNQYLCVHGGISPDLVDLKSVNNLDRFQEIPLKGLLCDLMWSDPIEEDSKETDDFVKNKARKVAYFFNEAPIKKVLKQTKT